MLCLELNTFDPTYFDFIEIASKMSKWEPKYHNGVSRTLKVTAPFGLKSRPMKGKKTAQHCVAAEGVPV